MEDKFIRAVDSTGSVGVKVIYAKEMVENARKCHDLTPTAAACLGRTLIMASMIGETLKGDEEKTTVMIKGDGPVGGIVCCSDNSMKTKGYVHNPEVDIPFKPNGKLDVSGAIGNGTLTIIKDLGLKEPYSGMINLVSGEIAEDFTYYYTKSEQQPSAIGLGVLVDKDLAIAEAGGFWISILPFAKDEVIDQIEKNLKNVPSVTSIFKDGKTCEEFLDILLEGLEYKMLDEGSKKPTWYCDCSKERFTEGLATLPKKDIREMIDEDGEAELCCHFCNKKYHFDKEELEEIYNSEGGSKNDN